MLTQTSRYYQYAAWGVLTLVATLIVCTFTHYGITWDEELQSQYGQAVADYYRSGFRDMRYQEIFNLYLYGGMFDGLAAVIDQFSPTRIYDTRHFLNALFGLIGLWGVWRLGRSMGAVSLVSASAKTGTERSRPLQDSGNAVGLIALILCATTPMYYGHMFNNPKDIPFAAGIIWTIYFMMRSYVRPTRSVLLKLAIILGLTLGVRVGGAMIFAFWLLPMGSVVLLPWVQQPDKTRLRQFAAHLWRLALRVVLPVGVIAYAVMLICWPWAQQHPITNPLRALSEFSNFPQDVEVLLDGVTYRSTELPWYYVPLYFAVSLPELLLFLLAVSIPLMPRIWRSFRLAQKQGVTLLVLMAGFPILYAMLRHPALYDAVRHFLFAVPLMCVIAALAAHSLLGWCMQQFDTRRAKRLIAGGLILAFALFIGSQILLMIRLHPYEYIYANQFAGGVRGAYGRYESDYWGSSFKEAAQDIQDLVAHEGGVPAGKIYRVAICGPWDSAMIYLPPDYQPVVANEPAEFFLSTTRWMCQNMRPGKEIIRVKRLGVPLSIVKDLRGGYEYYPGNEHDGEK